MRRASLALLFLAAPLAATTEEPVEVACPLCANAFRAMEWGSTNSLGGQDRDFLTHAAGGQVFLNACWTCPACRYTGLSQDFESEQAPKELLEALRKENSLRPAAPIDPKLKEAWKIPAWVRYDLWIQALRLRSDTPRGLLAFAHLRVAQTQRFDWIATEGVRDFEKRGGALWDAMKERLKEIDDGYEREITFARGLEGIEGAEREFALLLAAVIYKTRGEDPDAARLVAVLREHKQLEEGVAAALREIEERIARAREYTLLALPLFLEELGSEAGDREKALWLRYRVGELLRIVGEKEKALAQLEPLLKEEEPPDGFRAWVEEAIAKTGR